MPVHMDTPSSGTAAGTSHFVLGREERDLAIESEEGMINALNKYLDKAEELRLKTSLRLREVSHGPHSAHIVWLIVLKHCKLRGNLGVLTPTKLHLRS